MVLVARNIADHRWTVMKDEAVMNSKSQRLNERVLDHQRHFDHKCIFKMNCESCFSVPYDQYLS